ncbi:SIS domain-containing protein [Holdemania filiformis]|uniref:SIS domain-containing protein n=1 Tax=Holdemania filiformis TaxID=61171 RepID=UPI00242C989A|nr:SIS domain-containing protein [Holdemania filiformis]
MLPLIQWIERVPEKGRLLIATRKENLRPFAEYLADRLDDLNELVYVGSGSSYNSVMSVKGWIERITKLKVSVMTPNEYLYDRTVRNPNALTIFPSQSGTSVTTRKALQSAQRQGLPNVAVTQNPNQYMSQECGVHVDMMCADEEYKMRTVGYVSGMVVQLLIAMEIGLRRHTITAEEEQKLIAQIEAALTNWPRIETQAMAWYKRNETQLLNSAMFAVYGIDGLWGAALEGALKLIEIGKVMSIGYELEEGMHGPTLGFHPQLCVLVMNDGGRENDRARGLARFAKCEFGNGFLIGANPIDESDLAFTPQSCFPALEFPCAIQVLSWCLAQAKGVDLTLPIAQNEKPYFQTHQYTEKL